MSVGDGAFCITEAIDENIQWSLCSDPGVELTDGPCGGVSRVDVKRFTGFSALSIKLLKPAQGHVDLSAYLEEGGAIGGYGQGYGMDGAKVLGDILAAESVSPGRAADKEAVFVGEGHGKAIELELADHVIALLFQESRDPGTPGQHILL